MAIVCDNRLSSAPIAEVLTARFYWTRTFKYTSIWKYHITEKQILKDISSLPVSGIDISQPVLVMYRHHPQSTVIDMTTMEWITTQINARLVLSKEIVWCNVPTIDISKRKLDITINIPMQQL